MLSYALKDLLRNPRRTLSALAGVALAVGLFAATTFFVDASAGSMTRRALAPVSLDMQAGLSQPLASPLTLTEVSDAGSSLAAGQQATFTLTVTNGSTRTLTGIVVHDELVAPLTYRPGSTALDGRAVADPEGEPPVAAGVRIPSLAAGSKATLTYRVQAAAAVPALAALGTRATVSAAEDPGPIAANAPKALSLSDLSARVLQVAGVAGADPLGMVDLAGGSLRSGSKVIGQQVRVLAIEPDYLSHYSSISIAAGSYSPGHALLSPDAAAALGLAPGGTAQLTVPGRASPIGLTIGGIADFSHAGAIFASRSPDNQGEFADLPNVVVIPLARFQDEVLPALRSDAASATPQQKAPPYLELDLHIDRSRLNADPTVAVVTTKALKRSIERVAPGQVAVIDNLSDALGSARGDAILAKIVLLFLGLPGVLLAGYLSRYAGDLLARAQRREHATLRARGAQPAHLLSALTYVTVAVGALGSVFGLALGAAAVALTLGPAALRGASSQSLMISAGLAILAGVVTTALALYVPGRRALARETNEERRELELESRPLWLRLRLDLVLIACAALVWTVTLLAGGFKPTSAEGQSISLSFYTLLSPLLGWVGATLLAVRVLLWLAAHLARRGGAGFGGPATGILRRSLQRRPLALASGVIAVALAVSFGSSLALLGSTYDAQKQADARFVVGGDVRVTPSVVTAPAAVFADQLRVPGVTAVTPEAVTSSAIVGTDKKTLVAVDPAGLWNVASPPDSFFSGISAGAARDALQQDPAAVLVATEMARAFNIQPGDQVKAQLPGPGGHPAPVTFHVAGLFKNFSGYPQGVDLVGNLSFYQTATGSRRVDIFVLRTADSSPTGVTAVADRLRAGPGKTSPIRVETTATAFNRDASSLTALNMRGLGALESMFAIVMSAIGIAIFVFGLLSQRRKEYVTMRALGMAAGRLRALVLGEAAAVAIFSLVIGAAVGAGMAMLFVQVLAPLFSIPPASLTVPAGELSLLGTLVLCSMALAALLAGRSIRRLNPAELLREE